MGTGELFPSLRPKALRLMGFCERDFSLPVNVGRLPTGYRQLHLSGDDRHFRERERERLSLATRKTVNSVSVTLLGHESIRIKERYFFF